MQEPRREAQLGRALGRNTHVAKGCARPSQNPLDAIASHPFVYDAPCMQRTTCDPHACNVLVAQVGPVDVPDAIVALFFEMCPSLGRRFRACRMPLACRLRASSVLFACCSPLSCAPSAGRNCRNSFSPSAPAPPQHAARTILHTPCTMPLCDLRLRVRFSSGPIGATLRRATLLVLACVPLRSDLERSGLSVPVFGLAILTFSTPVAFMLRYDLNRSGAIEIDELVEFARSARPLGLPAACKLARALF
jgi:hypothetical protein